MDAWQKLQKFAVGVATASKAYNAVSKRLVSEAAREHWNRVHCYVLNSASFQGALTLTFAESDPRDWPKAVNTHDFQVLAWALHTIDAAVTDYLNAEREITGLVSCFGNLVDYWATTHEEPPPDLSVVCESISDEQPPRSRS